MTTGLFGGAFDPPHNGHVELVRAARVALELDEMVVLVSTRPGHKRVELEAQTRLRLAEAAFPELAVELDPHPRTIDTLRHGRWREPVFLIGADEFAKFLFWKEPDAVLEHARIAVATRPGYTRDRLDRVLAALGRPDRVAFFDIPPTPVSSRELRARLARGESIEGLVPPAVGQLIERLALYRDPGMGEG